MSVTKESILKAILLKEFDRMQPEVSTFEDDPMQFILRKYEGLNKTLTYLMTPSFQDYITGIYIVAPKPTTFKIVLHNGQFFFLQFTGKTYEATVAGKSYYLMNIGEKERCMLAIARLLRYGNPLKTKGPEGAEQGTRDEKGGEESTGGEGGGEEGGGILGGGGEEAGGEEETVAESRILEEVLKKTLSEGIGKKGFESEIKIYKLLKKYKKLPKGQGLPAGSSAVGVDLSFLDRNNEEHNLEVKYGLPDFGQLELNWNKNEGWKFKDYDKNDPKNKEKIKIVNLLRNNGVETQINSQWTATPNRYSKQNLTQKDRAQDYKNFPSIYIPVSPNLIKSYYKGKDVNYINIEPYGLYYFKSDDAKTGAIKFEPEGAKIRIRLKPRKSSDPKGYGFLGVLKISSIPKSPVDFTKEDSLKTALGVTTNKPTKVNTNKPTKKK